ncbi:Protein kinase domain protein [Kalmanozyma brasiliensis GHG001]|nr:Protein kinase domain protein [Kalmanozyma brasiliensis GHG001]EST06321.2 Protein kinase domain protein [Kalmanozyma brasiliensis GHG001]
MANKPMVKASQLTSRTANLDLHSTDTDRLKAGHAQKHIRPLTTRNDAEPIRTGKTQPRGAVCNPIGDSTSLLKRSFSKLRIKDAISPSRLKPPQATRQHLAPASKIPQATSPASHTHISSNRRPDPSAFVVPSFASPETKLTSTTQHKGLQPSTPRQADHPHDHYENVPLPTSVTHQSSPAADKKTTEIKMKAMQLGIFKISEEDLKERYQFLREVGAGEWGSVWSVEALKPLDHLPTSAYRSLRVTKLTGSGTYTIDNTSNFRPLAVKLCKRERTKSAAAMTQRLWNEFKILRMLVDQLPRAQQVSGDSPNHGVRNDRTGWHPNVVNFYEFLLTPKFAMLVMPKFDEPMKVCLGEPLCITFFQQLLSALHWLHQHGVCHNDIKVDNLGVTYDTSGLGRDTATLFDFGFANRYEPQHKDAFMSNEMWGTPEYLSPERCRAAWHDERKSDIWALGITFFEMLTGRTPFEHHDEKFDSKEKFEVYYTRAERGAWVGEWHISPGLEDLIRGMLLHSPSERSDAGGALLHAVFDPVHSTQCDSFDELLRFSPDEELVQQATREASPSPDVSYLQQELSDSDIVIRDLVQRTRPQRSRKDTALDEKEPLCASPGISRAAVAMPQYHVPGSPSLSQVGMDSRLTDLMCVSPPWRKGQPPRQGTPILSAKRDRIWTSHLPEDDDNDSGQSDASEDRPSPVSIVSASKAQPTKQSPFRLRLGLHAQSSNTTRPTQERMASTPLSAPAATTHSSGAPVILPQTNGNNIKPTTTRIDTSRVASLAKKFDASNFLSRPPPHLTSLTTSLTGRGLTLGKNGQGHRRSKSHTLMGTQSGVVPYASRRSTGSYVPGGEDALPRCARRLFDTEVETKREMDAATDIGSARSDTNDAGVLPVATHVETTARTPAPPAPQARFTESSVATPTGEAHFAHRLQKMASLAGLLTKMIDETRTVLSPQMQTPVRRGSSATASTEALDISPGLLGSPASSEGRRADVSMVSAAFSLDLSSSAHRSGTEDEAKRVNHPTPAQVEGMYETFLASQRVSRAGEGFMSPKQASVATTTSGIPSVKKGRKLAKLFSPSNSAPNFDHLREESAGSPRKSRTDGQRSVGKGGRLARLFRKQG